MAWHGLAWQGAARAVSKFRAVSHLRETRNTAWQGSAWQGTAGQGKVFPDGRNEVRLLIGKRNMARHGTARHGTAWLGEVRNPR